jgi:RND family efflux transporter MFP subunit
MAVPCPSTTSRYLWKLPRAVLTAAAAVLILSACSGPNPGNAARATPLAVEVVHATPADDSREIVASGVLERQHEIDLAFRTSGQIRDLRVNDGDVVRRGDVIGTLDPTELQLRLAQAQAEYDTYQRELARYETLSERGFASRQRIDYLQGTVALARTKVENARLQARYTELHSPVDGIVLARHLQRGEVVQAGESVVQVADSSSPLVLRAGVPMADLRALRIGEPASVAVDVLPGETLNGTVLQIGAEADRKTGTIDVQIAITADRDLQSGTYATARLRREPGTQPSGLMRLPAETLVKVVGERAEVFVVEPGSNRARRQAVRFAGFDGDDILVAGLTSDARVIAGGAGFVTDGATISPTPSVQRPAYRPRS